MKIIYYKKKVMGKLKMFVFAHYRTLKGDFAHYRTSKERIWTSKGDFAH